MTTLEHLDWTIERLEGWAEHHKGKALNSPAAVAAPHTNMHANYRELVEHLQSVRLDIVLNQVRLR